jgi:hypothetical protein
MAFAFAFCFSVCWQPLDKQILGIHGLEFTYWCLHIMKYKLEDILKNFGFLDKDFARSVDFSHRGTSVGL